MLASFLHKAVSVTIYYPYSYSMHRHFEERNPPLLFAKKNVTNSLKLSLDISCIGIYCH